MVLESDWVVCQGGQQAFSTEACRFCFLARPEIAQFSMSALLETQFCKQQKNLLHLKWECGVCYMRYTWSSVRSKLLIGLLYFLIFRWHILHSSILWSENMMGIFQENNVDVDDDYGPMLPKMKALKALHLTLREKHMNIRRYALRIIEPLSLSGSCWKHKQSCCSLQAAYQLQQVVRTLQTQARRVVCKMESHIEFLKKKITQNRCTFCPANFWNGWECHCLLPHLEGCASLLGCGGL